METLGEVDADVVDDLEDFFVLDKLGDGFDLHRCRQFVDGVRHGPVDRVGGHVPDDAAVDLEEVDVQVTQVAERGKPGAEVVDGEAHTKLRQRGDEPSGGAEVGDSGGFGDLEPDDRGRETLAAEQFLDGAREALVLDAVG